MYHSVRCKEISNYLVTGSWDLWSSFVCFLLQTSHSISWIFYFTCHTEHNLPFSTFLYLTILMQHCCWTEPNYLVIGDWALWPSFPCGSSLKSAFLHHLNSIADGGHGDKFLNLSSFVLYAHAAMDIIL